MYNASSDFHNAVANGAHQIALLIFNDAVFTNDDINVTSGIEFNDYFNTDEDLSIGRALSNEISFSIFNDHGYLNDYGFGDFIATIGARIGDSAVLETGGVQATGSGHTYVGFSSSPYLKRDGTALSTQPTAAVDSILIYDGNVYVHSANNTVVVYNNSTGDAVSVNVNDFMKAQMAKWAGEGLFYEDRILKIWRGAKMITYEFVPLGVFNAERPNVPYVNEIRFTCYDLMQRFEKDMPSDEELGLSYPCSFATLFVNMCNHLNINYRTSTFINSTAQISARPDDFNNVTMREVLQWLAEAAGSVARFDRDGYLIMDWLHTGTTTTIDENGYIDFKPYWYSTKKAEMINNRASNGSYEHTYGTGDETYLIQDNPLLKGVN